MKDDRPEHPRAQVLGRLLVMQQTLMLLHDDAQIASFVRETFMDVPGVVDCRVELNAVTGDAGAVDDLIEIRTATCSFGVIRIHSEAGCVYRCYKPFLDNIAQLVATMLESRRNAEDLAAAHELLALKARESLRDREEALRQKSALLDRVINATQDLIFVKDRDRRIVLCNTAYANALGATPDGLYGKNDMQSGWQVEHIKGDAGLGTRGYEQDDEAALAGQTVHNPRDLASVHGRRVVFDTIKVPLRDDRGAVIGIVGVARDVTVQREVGKRFRNIMEFAPTGIAASSRDGRFLEVNNAFCRMFGYDRNELQHLRVADLRYPGPADDTTAQRERLLRGELPSFSCIKRCVRKDGLVFWAQVSCSLVHGEAGEEPYFITHLEDVTKRRKDEEQLRIADSVFKNSSEGILLTDDQGRIAAVNPAFTRLTGWTLDEVAGKTPAFLQSGRQSEAFYEEMWAQLVATGHWEGEVWNRRKDGSEFAEYLSISADRSECGRVEHYVGLFSDITARKRNEETIWRQANFDALTGLPNRRLFRDRLELQAKRSRRGRNTFALVFVDLDRFKEVNDTLGHGKGDLLLVEASRRLLGCLRDSDAVSRLGGDEFTVILHEACSPGDVDPIVHRILLALSQPYQLTDGDVGYVSASIGVTFCPTDSENWETLLQYADQAMYAAKSAGRNCYRYFTAAMQIEMQQRASLTNDLRLALARQELEVYYQGIVDAGSGEIVKAEALLRWHHPTRGLITPALFIPLAEESGLILEIGDWVLEEVIRRITDWRRRTGRIVPISVNKSPAQFFRCDHQAWISAVERAALPPGSLTVEITEGLLIQQAQRVNDALADFQQAGIEVAIDDFGTGFSSLAYLNEFQIDFLKIDRSFVAKLVECEDARAVTEAIIVMARKLGIRTIAEGVETPCQRDILITQGCDLLQGYLFHRPSSAEEFEQVLFAPARVTG